MVEMPPSRFRPGSTQPEARYFDPSLGIQSSSSFFEAPEGVRQPLDKQPLVTEGCMPWAGFGPARSEVCVPRLAQGAAPELPMNCAEDESHVRHQTFEPPAARSGGVEFRCPGFQHRAGAPRRTCAVLVPRNARVVRKCVPRWFVPSRLRAPAARTKGPDGDTHSHGAPHRSHRPRRLVARRGEPRRGRTNPWNRDRVHRRGTGRIRRPELIHRNRPFHDEPDATSTKQGFDAS